MSSMLRRGRGGKVCLGGGGGGGGGGVMKPDTCDCQHPASSRVLRGVIP